MVPAIPGAKRPACAGRFVSGFSLVELVITIVVLGALAVTVVPVFSERSAYRAGAYADELLSAARHAQKAAIARGCNVQLQLSAGGYALYQQSGCHSGAFSLPLPHPGRSGSYAGPAPSGATISGSGAITFFADGSSSGGSFSAAGRSFAVVASTGYVREN